MENVEPKPPLGRQMRSRAFVILGFVVAVWAVELANLAADHKFCAWGIRPRTMRGLPGIVLGPFLHLGVGHVLLNTTPFIVLGWLVSLRDLRAFWEVSAFIVLLGGSMVWLFGRAASHVGASGLVFGYFGFLVGRGWYERSLGAVLVALIVLFLYGGLLWGLLPISSRTSWESHLFGLAAGVLAARTERPVEP